MTGKEKIQACYRIVEFHTASELDGILMDATTANAVVLVHKNLGNEAQAKFEAIMETDLPRAVGIVWKLVA